MKMFRTWVTVVVVAMVANVAWSQTRGKVSRKPVAKTSVKAAAPKAFWVNFNGGEDVTSIAHDDINVYVTMAYSKRMVIINKTTGKIFQIESDNEIASVVVANNKCYYYVLNEGIYCFNSATGQSEGPLFGLPGDDDSTERIAASPDGNYLICCGYVIDLRSGKAVGNPGDTRCTAVNNIGGAYLSSPEPKYCPLGGNVYVLSNTAVVHDIYPDALTGDTFWCCEQGVGYTPMVPEAGAGIKKVRIPGVDDSSYLIPHHITRDDEGNFIVTTNKGIIFGGKTLDSPGKLVDRLNTGVKNEYGSELTLNYFPGLVSGDGMGNIIFGNENYACICIYNPNGLKGYTELKGKAVKF